MPVLEYHRYFDQRFVAVLGVTTATISQTNEKKCRGNDLQDVKEGARHKG